MFTPTVRGMRSALRQVRSMSTPRVFAGYSIFKDGHILEFTWKPATFANKTGVKGNEFVVVSEKGNFFLSIVERGNASSGEQSRGSKKNGFFFSFNAEEIARLTLPIESEREVTFRRGDGKLLEIGSSPEERGSFRWSAVQGAKDYNIDLTASEMVVLRHLIPVAIPQMLGFTRP